MPSLTRRRSDNPHRTTWHVYFGDVHVGTIGERAGVPVGLDQWEWSCGLHPGQHSTGTAATFEKARAGFEADWQALLPQVPEGAFDQISTAFTAWKYRMWDCGCRMPTQVQDGRSRCFCGSEITNAGVNAHIYERHMELA